MRVQVLDGSVEAGERSRRMLGWDVSNGVARSFIIRGCACAHCKCTVPKIRNKCTHQQRTKRSSDSETPCRLTIHLAYRHKRNESNATHSQYPTQTFSFHQLIQTQSHIMIIWWSSYDYWQSLPSGMQCILLASKKLLQFFSLLVNMSNIAVKKPGSVFVESSQI